MSPDISSHGLPKVTQAGNNLYTAITYDMDQPASIITTGVQSETYTINPLLSVVFLKNKQLLSWVSDSGY